MTEQVVVRGQTFTVTMVSAGCLPGKMGGWDVVSSSRKCYRVEVFDPDGTTVTCDCPDFRVRKRKRCKHIEAVFQVIEPE